MRDFLKSFGYAAEGICHGVKSERNFKLHQLAAIIVVGAGLYTGLSKMEWFIVIILIGGMFTIELMNTAVERIVDLISTERQPLAKQAKDLAAGAVLIYAITSGIIGLAIFLPKWFM